jgi:hypothetical protein
LVGDIEEQNFYQCDVTNLTPGYSVVSIKKRQDLPLPRIYLNTRKPYLRIALHTKGKTIVAIIAT